MQRAVITFFIGLLTGFTSGFFLIPDSPVLSVTFFDVGQGDAIFIESPAGVQVLIDGGPNGAVLRTLGEHMKFFDRTIDIIIATHPDKDHIAGLPFVFDRYEIRSFGTSTVENMTVYSQELERAVEQEPELVRIPLVRGTHIDLGGGVLIEVLFPDRKVEGMESNAGSVVLRLTYGETSFLLTGDSSVAIEEFLVSTSCLGCLRSTVLQAGHHGSKTSTGETFLNAVSPEVVVFSTGKDNRYGHPSSEVVARVEKTTPQWFGTYRDGSIIFISNGSRVWQEG